TGELVAFDPPYNGQKIQHKNHKLFLFPIEQGKTYQIDMESKAFDSYLYLENPGGAYLKEDDDSGGNLNARILHKANKTGKHRIIATHFDGKLGQFTLTIRQTEATPLVLKDAFFFINRGNTWQIKKNYDKAIKEYDEAIRLEPKNAIDFFNRGAAFGNRG